MKVSIEWLRDFTDINVNLSTLADKLTRTGTKVETISVTGSNFSGIYVGQIEEITPHTNSEHLRVCRVNMGNSTHLQIVTAAENVFVGAKVPVAVDGAVLADGTKIKNTELRGVLSQGMFCSVAETGYNSKVYPEAVPSAVWILEPTTELGITMQNYMGLGDEILDFEITSNRPDCLSVEGLARETAITLKKPFTPLPYNEVIGTLTDKSSNYLTVCNRAETGCLRYCGRVVKNVKIAPSPAWMRRRLAALGITPINNIVDITNYVMLEIGQPMHAFDLRDIEGKEINIRYAANGEKLQTLDGVARTLTDKMLLICDAVKPLALAGVMGGENSEIKPDTTSIFFEAANFDPDTVRHQAAACHLRTEASGRFDKAVDPDTAVRGLNRALELVEQLGIGEVVSETLQIKPAPFSLPSTTFTLKDINSYLGTTITADFVRDILEQLGCQVTEEQENFTVTPPNWRRDLLCMADYAEEAARFYGYDNIPSSMPKSQIAGGYTAKQLYERQIKNVCVALGFYEMMTLSFESPNTFAKLGFTDQRRLQQVTISNAPTETSCLRTDMLPACLRVISSNVNQFNDSGKLFELANCYYNIPDAEGLPSYESKLIAAIFSNDAQAKAGSMFYELKNLLQETAETLGIKPERFTYQPLDDLPMYHPYRSAYVNLDGNKIGTIAYVDKQVLKSFGIKCEVAVMEIKAGSLTEQATFARKQQAISRFPGYSLDLAFEMDLSEPVGNLLDVIKQNANSYLSKVDVFDVYSGERVARGKKSVAINLLYRHPERTLKEEDVKDNIAEIIKKAEEKTYTLRA